MIFYSCCPTLYLVQKIVVDGHAYTMITSKGEQGFTQVPSGDGIVISTFGSIYTTVTGDIATSTSTTGEAVHVVIVTGNPGVF